MRSLLGAGPPGRGVDTGDALARDGLRFPPEGHAGQDAQLGLEVDPLEVVRRVRFRQALRLRPAHRLGEGVALGEPVEDEAGGPVQGPFDLTEPVRGGQPGSGLQHGDGSAHGGREAQRGAMTRGQAGQLGTVGGHHRLVGRDHGRARLEGPPRQRGRRLLAHDGLDHDLGGIDDGPRVRGEQCRRGLAVMPRGVPHRDAHDLEQPGAGLEQAVYAEADGAEAEEADARRAAPPAAGK